MHAARHLANLVVAAGGGQTVGQGGGDAVVGVIKLGQRGHAQAVGEAVNAGQAVVGVLGDCPGGQTTGNRSTAGFDAF